MGYLFAKDVLRQSIRLGLAGAWDHEYPEISESMDSLKETCPNLVKSFLPVSEHKNEQEEDELALYEPPSDMVNQVAEDENHTQVRNVLICGIHIPL